MMIAQVCRESEMLHLDCQRRISHIKGAKSMCEVILTITEVPE